MPIPEILTVQFQPLPHAMQPFQGRHKNRASSMPGSISESQFDAVTTVMYSVDARF